MLNISRHPKVAKLQQSAVEYGEDAAPPRIRANLTMRPVNIMIPILLTIMLASTGCYPFEAETDTPPRINSIRTLVGDFIAAPRRHRLPRLFVNQGTPVTLEWDVVKGPASGVTISGDGTVTMSGHEEIIIRSRQTVGRNFFFEVTLPADFGNTQQLPYIGLDLYPVEPRGTVLWGINSIGPDIRVDSQSKSYPVQAGDRIAMEAQSGVVRYYRNYAGPGSPVLYTSRLPVIQSGQSFPITMVKMIGDHSISTKVKLTIN